MQMTDSSLKRLNKVGRHTDDQTKGLHLWVKPNLQRYWIFRYTLNGKREDISLGAYPEIGLKQARQRALEARLKVSQGICPAQAKKIVLATVKETKKPKFSTFALEYIETMRPKWRNQKHADQWVSTVRTYAFPALGEMRLDEIDTPHIQAVLKKATKEEKLAKVLSPDLPALPVLTFSDTALFTGSGEWASLLISPTLPIILSIAQQRSLTIAMTRPVFPSDKGLHAHRPVPVPTLPAWLRSSAVKLEGHTL